MLQNMMKKGLTTRQKIVEKIVRNDAGETFRLIVLAYEEAGEIKCRILSATALQAPISGSKGVVLTLSGKVRRQVISQVVKEYKRGLIPSPFESLLYFNLSIPRGPNA